jgi:hypothetical protein
VLAEKDGERILIIKGAPETVLARATLSDPGDGRALPLDAPSRENVERVQDTQSACGYRLLAVAWKAMPANCTQLEPDDERDLVLAGFCVFVDPPKPSATNAVARLAAAGVRVKVVSGDHEAVVRHLVQAVGLPAQGMLTGTDIATLTDPALIARVEDVDLFARVTLIDRDGRIVHQGTGNDLELRATGGDATVHQGIRVPGAVYNRFKSERLDIHLEYSFTLFRAGATYALPARDGDQRMPGIGWCATQVDEAGTRVRFQCLQPGERPSCLSLVLEHAPTGQRNPEVSLCAPDYSPYPGHTLPDALSRFGGRLPFYDPSGLVRYPVGGPQLADARVVVTAFEPREHFVRRVTIPAVRLEEWEPQAAAEASLRLPPAAFETSSSRTRCWRGCRP